MTPVPRLAPSIEEAAQVLSLGRNLTPHLIDDGQLRMIRVGRRVLVPVKAIEEMLAS